MDYGTICRRKAEPNEVQYRVLGEATIEYSEQNGNEPEDILVLEPIRSGFEIAELAEPGKLPYLLIRPEEFGDIFCEVEEGGERYGR